MLSGAMPHYIKVEHLTKKECDPPNCSDTVFQSACCQKNHFQGTGKLQKLIENEHVEFHKKHSTDLENTKRSSKFHISKFILLTCLCKDCEKDDDRHWQQKFLQLRKTQEQLEDCTTEIEAKIRKK